MDAGPRVSASHRQDHDAIKRKWKGGERERESPAAGAGAAAAAKKEKQGEVALDRRPAINRASGHIQSARWARNQAAVSSTFAWRP